MSSEAQSLSLPDGRTLCFATFGASAGSTAEPSPVVFYFHGFPGCQHEGRIFHKAALEKGVRIVAISRPGYCGSTHQPDRTILSFATDVIAVADHLRIQRFAVLGVSGGGPYALACMHVLPPSRLLGAAVVSGMYPPGLGFSGMMLRNRLLFTLAPRLPAGVVAAIIDRGGMGPLARDETHPERYEEAVTPSFARLQAEDRAVVEADGGRVSKLLVESSRHAFRDGPQGAGREAMLFGSPWGVDLGDLRPGKGKLVLWHGKKDINVPVAMAQTAAMMIPDAQLRVEEDDAHISLWAHKAEEVFATLVDMLSK